jgi:LysR family hydrogen peroxide-inducible transcriptional activator
MNLSAISLHDLEYVVAVADHGSFVKAAEQCRVAQPSLSVQISKLEARLEAIIFERTHPRARSSLTRCGGHWPRRARY